jgi:hypothetical protein
VSAIGLLVARVVGSVGGPVATGAVVAGGIAVGALGGGLFASGGQQASASAELAVYPCPNVGPALSTIHAGQQVLATGRTEDSTWLRIHFPDPSRAEAWVEAGPLTVDGAVASLPVATCVAELAIVAPSVIPQESFTVTENNPPSLAPGTPTPTPTPTATVTANTRPTLTTLTASTGQISYDTGGYCPNAVHKVTFKVKAADTGGVAGVSLFWRKPGAGRFTEGPMTRIGGSATNGTWQASLDTAANGITAAGNLAYYAQARDSANATRRIPVSNTNTIKVKVCENTGPTITNASSNQGNTLFWDPLGVGNCQTASNITAIIKDVDGVASAALFYRRPGDGSFQSKPMNNTTIKGRWYANLDTLGDKITIPNPPTGTLRWYIKTADKKGAPTQSPTRSITIRRCDSEANFDGVFPTNPNDYYDCSTTAQITIGTYANDEDQPNNNLTVVFHWILTNPRTGDGPISGTARATIKDGVAYQGTTRTFDGKTFYAGQLTAWAVTTDRYGGTTTSSRDTHSMSCGSP